MQNYPGDSIRCAKCGVPNTIAAYACARCGDSLLGNAPMPVRAPRPQMQPAVRPARVPVPWKKLVLTAGIVIAVVVGGWLGMQWAVENRYPFGEPRYDYRPASHWVTELRNDDVYLRRRAALALVTLSPKLNRPDAEATIPWLERSLADDDEVVRTRVQAALDELGRQHPGVTGKPAVSP